MSLSKEEIAWYLGCPESWPALFERARRIRSEHFGNELFAYGFDYFSTYCKNSCAFCLYRKENARAPRYRHGIDEVVRTAGLLAESGVHLIDLTMGEDPHYLDQPDLLCGLVRATAQSTGLPVMVSPGVIASQDLLRRLREAGATWLALYQESFSRERFGRLRLRQDFEERMAAKRMALQAGLLVEEGLLVGYGETRAELAESLLRISEGGASQVRVMTFVPQPGTPMAKLPAQSSERELAAIALLRIMNPGLLIPASLDVEGPEGLRARLDAGANVITSIIPPDAGLEGVARNRDIEDGGRTLPQIMPAIEAAGLKRAPQERYEAFIAAERERKLEQAARETETEGEVRPREAEAHPCEIEVRS